MIRITWLGHACFKVEKDGYRVVFDPFEDNYVPGIGTIREKANLVVCSHEHGDHNGRDSVELLEEPNCPYSITEIHTYHDEEKGALRGENTITLMDDGEIRFAHFGDLGCRLGEEEVELLKDLDFVFVPVGGYYTIDGKTAVEICREISPKLVIPMHFRDPELGFGFPVISTVSDFAEAYENVTFSKESSVEYNPSEYNGGPRALVLVPEKRI